jgi:hypothetical protein
MRRVVLHIPKFVDRNKSPASDALFPLEMRIPRYPNCGIFDTAEDGREFKSITCFDRGVERCVK